MAKPLTWVDEAAELSPEKWKTILDVLEKESWSEKSLKELTPHAVPAWRPKPALKPAEPRWQRELRVCPSLRPQRKKTTKAEVDFELIRLELIGDSHNGRYYRMLIDDIPWTGHWQVEVSKSRGYVPFQTFGSGLAQYVPIEETPLTLVATNFAAPHQKVTFELNGSWKITELAKGGILFRRELPAPITMKKYALPIETDYSE